MSMLASNPVGADGGFVAGYSGGLALTVLGEMLLSCSRIILKLMHTYLLAGPAVSGYRSE